MPLHLLYKHRQTLIWVRWGNILLTAFCLTMAFIIAINGGDFLAVGMNYTAALFNYHSFLSTGKTLKRINAVIAELERKSENDQLQP